MNPLTPLELLDIIEREHNFESPSLRLALTELEELKRYPTSEKAITHEEARNLLNELVPTDAITPSQIDDLHIYITEQKLKDQAHEELKRDVKRYFELEKRLKYISNIATTPFEIINTRQTYLDVLKELYMLEEKLSKVGNEE